MTRLSTLCAHKDSMLATMFSGRHRVQKDADGYYFIDSNGKYFEHILDFLRHETLPPSNVAWEVYKEASYFNIISLQMKLQATPPVARMIVRDCYRSQFPDYCGIKLKVIQIAMDNAGVDRAGEVVLHCFRKEFVPRSPMFNAGHECVADTAHINVGPWEGRADEEDLVKCLENDLVEDGFIIRPHEQKRRCKYYSGQNCQKCAYKIVIIFK